MTFPAFSFNNEASEVFGGDFTFKRSNEEAVGIFEAAPSENSEIVALADQQLRSIAMALALAFIAGGDFSFEALSDSAIVIADADESGDLDDEENEYLNELLQATADALISMGADPANVASFIDDEDDEAGATLGAFLAEKMEGVNSDDETLIAQYAIGGDLILESVVKAVRDGRVVLKKKKRLGFHAKLSAAQRAGLKKARSKAFTGAAKLARKKSMRIRRKMGL